MTSANINQQIFVKFERYDFDKDEDFQAGLQSVLTSHQNKSQEELDKLKEKAKWFYFSKVVQKFDYTEYLAWKSNEPPASESSDNQDTPRQDVTTNGIKEIPDEINHGTPSTSTTKPRPKPWEKRKENIPETI
ncbi:4026_t:CDS:2 [Cetraspora pellucida]|uniref:4026_t:CDS:1 n=1 Tax=Cetraspora pellucida TaxID=1433469 RepID=A0A9N9C680_9GLOM|nr:4026_t:CDS:2 [Cetraspora pellucida]